MYPFLTQTPTLTVLADQGTAGTGQVWEGWGRGDEEGNENDVGMRRRKH